MDQLMVECLADDGSGLQHLPGRRAQPFEAQSHGVSNGIRQRQVGRTG